MADQNLARVQGAQFEAVERNVYGDTAHVEQVINKLIAGGWFIRASGMKFNPEHGSYAVVRFYKPTTAVVPDATPAAGNDVMRPTRAAAVAVRRTSPAPSARPWWFRPLAWVGSVIGSLMLLALLGAWVLSKVSETFEGVDGKTVLGFLVILTIVAIIIFRSGSRGGSSDHPGEDMGFHWTPCKK